MKERLKRITFFKELRRSFEEDPFNFLVFVALIVVVFFIPFKIRVSNIFIGVATFFWLINIKKNIYATDKGLLIPLGIFTSLYIALIVGMIYTDDISEGLYLLERKLAILIIPTIVLVSSIDKIHVRILEWTLIIAVATASLICHYYAFSEIIHSDLPWSSFFLDYRFHNTFFTSPLQIHPAYLSLFICLALMIIFVDLKYATLYKRMLSIVLIMYFVLTQLQLIARAGLVALLAIIIILMVYQTIQNRKIIVFSITCASLILIIFFTLKFVPEIKVRMIDSMANMTDAVSNNDQSTSPALHVKSWYCAFTSWLDGNILIGQGTGDERSILLKCYDKNSWELMVKGEYDSHNEYLSNLVRHGLLGLFLWLTCLLYPMYLSLRSFDIVYFSFIVLVSIAAFSESILRGQTTLVFYTVFNAIYFKRYWINTSIGSQVQPGN
jgi:O-antigen ligase